MHVPVVVFDGFDPLDGIAPHEALYAGGLAPGGAVTVELVSAEGPREVIGDTGGPALRAEGVLDPERANVLLVPGASGRTGKPGEVPEENAVLTGAAHGADGEAPLGELTRDGDRPAWKQSIAKPVRLDVTVDGGTLRGTSKAGRLPSSKVTGERRTVPGCQA
ncbi:hypothetical protein [Streptomyces sp. NPDC057325]|uniref:hypothetical protein n=1 Tax=unclassified Streptomyces TaxID=2593676 RepID=UPI0036421E6C